MLYSNRQYKERCIGPFSDSLCWKCQEARRLVDKGKDRKVSIDPPKLDDVGDTKCHGSCWERDLCNTYDWGSDQQLKEVFPGMIVYFVFQQRNIATKRVEYCIWGRSKVERVDETPTRELKKGKGKYYYWIHFEPFDALPPTKWSQPISDIDLVGSLWGQGFYRYIYEKNREEFLDKIFKGNRVEESKKQLITVPSPSKMKTVFASNIEQKINEIAIKQGRMREDIIKQAVAEWLQRQQ